MPIMESVHGDGVHQPLVPLNTSPRSSTLQSKPPISSKPPKLGSKNDVEICHIRLDEKMIDSQLASRLAVTAIEQFLFFKGQIPLPVLRLATAPASNDRMSRKRAEFVTQHSQLVTDLRRAIREFSLGTGSEDVRTKQFRCVVTLGPGTMPKAMVLFQLTGDHHSESEAGISVSKHSPFHSETSPELKTANTWNDQPPPDSDSDSDSNSVSDVKDLAARHQVQSAIMPPPVNLTPSSKLRSFIPFSDPSPAVQPESTHSSQIQQKNLPGASKPPPEPSTLRSHSSLTRPSSTPLGASNIENSSSIQMLERRYKKAEREVIIAIGNMDTISDEVELSKIHVYIEAKRDFGGENWQPRPSAAKTLDALVQYPDIPIPTRTKLARLNACAVKVSTTRTDKGLSSAVSTSLSGAIEEVVWFEWDGKLGGVE